MPTNLTVAPEDTAVRVALWRALHVRLDAPPHILDDEVGLRLIDPDDDWRARPDMDPQLTRGTRASITTRTRFVEDMVAEQAERGVDQYVILGAGLDTFAQRRPDIAARLTVFEVDQPGPQAWKQQRLRELGFDIPAWLRFVPVDFENDSWWERLRSAGFDPARAAIVVSTGVTMYLSREANLATWHQVATLASGSVLATTFMLPVDLLAPQERPRQEETLRAARASGTPFISFFAPDEILALAREIGFTRSEYISTADLTQRYFAGRTDDLRPARGEQFLLART